MPNETSNLLEIFGPQNDINSFIDSHRKFIVYPGGIYWDFEVSVPIVNESDINKKGSLGNISRYYNIY